MTTSQMNINEASKACGLSPSVLRIWELRYGWPNPKRKPNGYRAYNVHQILELKRVSELVKRGTPISSLIIDGLPRWPTTLTSKHQAAALTKSKLLTKPAGNLEAKLQTDLIDALEKRQSYQVKELLQRSFWSVRPDDEALTALLPTLTGLEELALAERPLAEDAEVRQLVRERCQQLLRRYRKNEAPEIWVLSASPVDQTLAILVALILCQRGHQAQPWLEGDVPAVGSLLLAGDHQDTAAMKGERRLIGRVSSLGGAGVISLNDLLTAPQSNFLHPQSAN